ncbi:MAG: GNAT family N-acetyltransferase [Nitrospirae bacterium]|nr:GNAT family N-acetyltransferase [Nitrospirota bacterium]
MKKLCYILPSYSENSHEHFYTVLRLLQEIGKYVEIALVIEKASTIPRLDNVKTVIVQRYGFSKNKILRLMEMAFITARLQMKNFKKFYIRTSDTATVPVCLVTKLLGGEVYFWRSGQGKESIPGWSVNWKVIRNKLQIELMFKTALRLTNWFVTGPESMGTYFIKEWGVDSRKVLILYNDVDTSRFKRPHDTQDIAALKHHTGIPDNAKIVLMVHNMSPVRRTTMYLPKAIVDTIAQRQDVYFVLVGGGSEKPFVQEKVAQCGVNSYVSIVGSVPNREIDKYYAIADIFIMPSYVEGFPRVLIEAMASGLAFVATDSGGVMDIVTEAQKQFVVPRDDPEAFSNAIKSLLADDHLRQRLGMENQIHVQKYAVENVAMMYIDKIFPINICSIDKMPVRIISELVDIDAGCIAEKSTAYSHEHWSHANFTKELPQKKLYSQVATDDGKVVGFWIVSKTDQYTLHTHRVAVRKAYRRRGLAKKMFDAIVSKATKDGFKQMTLTLAIVNTEAMAFYKQMGFTPLQGGELDDFIIKKGHNATNRQNYIEQPSEHMVKTFVC